MDRQYGFSTRVLRSDEAGDAIGNPLSTPIAPSSTFAFATTRSFGEAMRRERPAFLYSRLGNPTVRALEYVCADLEDAEACQVFASGMAAIAAALSSTLSPGDTMLCPIQVYGPVYRLIEELIKPRSIEVVYLDVTDLSSWDRPARVMFVETIAATSYPIADISALSHIKKKESILIVDNTLATPIYCRPLDFGADLVCHSATKYFGGHDDVLAGVLCGSRELVERAQAWQSVMGAVLDPFGAFLVHRGLKTLPLRVARQSENALVLAKFLESHPRVSRVYYPGLESYPQRELASRQLTGYGGVLSFELSDPTQGELFVDKLRLVAKAASVGGLITKIHHPDERYTAEHLIATHQRQTLLRVSVGCEDSDDIVTDFENALNA